MTYMPTKARKWLATGIASVVAASVLPFAFIAPASATSTAVAVSVSKPVRATDTLTGSGAVGNGTTGFSIDDTAGLIFTMDDSFGNIEAKKGINVEGLANALKTKLYLRLDTAPTDATFKTNDDTDGAGGNTLTAGTWYFFTDGDSLTANASPNNLGTYKEIFSGTGVDNDDSALGIHILADKVGTYTLSYYIDLMGDGNADSTDMVGTITVNAYGAPVLTSSVSALTSEQSKEDTITLTLTGGALASNESYLLTDDSTLNTTFRTYGWGADTSNPRYKSALSAATAFTFNDTQILDESAGWLYSAADALTLTVNVLTPSDAVDFAGTIRAIRNEGLVTSSVSISVTQSLLVNAIESIALTGPTTNIYSTIADDDSDNGTYDYKIKPNADGVTVTGTFQLTNTADYGKSVTVGIYSVATPSVNSTAIASSSVTTSALGVGTFSFALTSSRLDVAGDLVTVVVGSLAISANDDLDKPKRLTITAEAVALRATFNSDNHELYTASATAAHSGRIVKAAGSTVTFTATIKDQFGALKSGYKLKAMTGGTASATGVRNAGVSQVSAASGAAGTATVSYTDASTSTANLYDTVSLYILDSTDDTQMYSGSTAIVGTYTIHFATATLSGLTINGLTNAAWNAEGYEPWVPFDGTADIHESAYTGDDSDKLIKISVFSDVSSSTVTSNVIFTGSAGVRFAAAGAGSPLAEDQNEADARATIHNEGKTVVYDTTAHNTTSSKGEAIAYFYCTIAGPCTVTATQGASSLTATVTYGTPATAAMNVTDVKVNDVAATTGTSVTTNKVKVSFKVTDVFGNAVKTLGESGIGVDVMISGVGSVDGLGSQGTLKTATNGTAQFYASSSAAGSMQIELDGSGADFGDAASTALAKPASADKKTVTITWTAAPVVVPEVVYAAPSLTVTKSGTKIILDGTAVEGEGDIIVYIKRVGTTKWVEQAATIEVAAPGDYNGMRKAPKGDVLIRVKQEGTGKFSNQVVVLK